jgi:hypothetical protein
VGSSVNAIDASSDSNVWAVGTYITINEEEGTASWHLSGSTWSAVTVPTGAPQGTPDDDLMGVATLGANGGRAVGWDPSPPGNSTTAQALRWNGTAWTQASTPITPAGDTDHLVAVAALSGSSAWAVGSCNNSVNGGKTGTYILHWTGKTWKRSESPN